MTLTFFDGFDMYDGTILTPYMRGWEVGATTGNLFQSNQAGRFGTSKGVNSASNNTHMIRPIGVVAGSVAMGVAVFVPATGLTNAGTGQDMLRVLNGTTLQCKLGYKVDGSLVTGRGDFGANLIATSAAGVVVGGVWAYVEIEVTRSATVGVFKVYWNGVLVINSTGVNTGALDIDRVALAAGSGAFVNFDDFYVNPNGLRLGERRVEYLPVSVDTVTKDWTASTGTNHAALLNEIPTNGDSNYISDSVVGHKDLFDVADLSSPPSTIDGVQVVMVARKDDATTRAIRSNMKNGATASVGATQNMGASYQPFVDMFLTNPNTAAAWTAADVNATQIGVEVVT